jgi:hypothetical protein
MNSLIERDMFSRQLAKRDSNQKKPEHTTKGLVVCEILDKRNSFDNNARIQSTPTSTLVKHLNRGIEKD